MTYIKILHHLILHEAILFLNPKLGLKQGVFLIYQYQNSANYMPEIKGKMEITPELEINNPIPSKKQIEPSE